MTAALLASVRNYRTQDMKNLIVPKLYQKVQEEVDVLEPILLAFNFGRGSANQEYSEGFRDACHDHGRRQRDRPRSQSHGSIEGCFRVSCLVAEGEKCLPYLFVYLSRE